MVVILRISLKIATIHKLKLKLLSKPTNLCEISLFKEMLLKVKALQRIQT